MIYFFYGKPCSGKSYFSNRVNLKNKIILDEAHNIDFSKYRLLNKNNYIIIVQYIELIDKEIINKSDEIVYFHFDINHGFCHSETSLEISS